MKLVNLPPLLSLKCLRSYLSKFQKYKLICALGLSISLSPSLYSNEDEIWVPWSGYWYIDGFEQWLEGEYPDWHSFYDADWDSIPDWADPYPYDTYNNTAWSSAGNWRVDGVDQWFDSVPYAVSSWNDSNGNGRPDDWESSYNPNGSWYDLGGYWYIPSLEGQFSYPQRFDYDNDGLPDYIDPYPSDSQNNAYPSPLDSDGDGIYDYEDLYPYDPLNGMGDSDGDGIPDYADLYPNDYYNGAVFWGDIYFRIDGEDMWFSGGYYQPDALGDTDQDGLPDIFDPYPTDPNNGNPTL